MSNYEISYRKLLTSVLSNRVANSRTGDVIKKHNVFIDADLSEGFPVITGRKMFWKNIIGEAEWMLSGSTNIKDLHAFDVHIWDKFADEHGDLGPTYGAQLYKQWESVMQGIKNNPLSRRHIINLWNTEEIHKMQLPPCYFALQFYVNGNLLNVAVSSRSSDLAVGLPYDVPVVAYLLYRAAEQINMYPGVVHFNICDAHINVENIKAVKEYLKRPVHALASLVNFNLCNYESSPPIKMIVKL